MAYTLGQAAKATGKSKTTISRAIQKGKVSAEKDAHGAYRITPDELHRLYPMVSRNDAAQPSNVTPRITELDSENRVLRAELDASRQQSTLLTDQLADTREDRDRWRQQATALLTEQRPPTTSAPWWRRWVS